MAPLVIHPDIYLDQTTKILTLGKGEADILGQKYILPALPFKLPATPALNSLQSLYPREPSSSVLATFQACSPPLSALSRGSMVLLLLVLQSGTPAPVSCETCSGS